MNRSEEVRRILSLTTEEVLKEANGQLKLFETLDEVYDFLAEEMVKEFEKAAEIRDEIKSLSQGGDK